MKNREKKQKKRKALLQIRADKDNKLSKLRNAFTIWKYNTKMDNIKNKYKNKNSNEQEIKEEINKNGKKVIKITKIEEKVEEEENDNIIVNFSYKKKKTIIQSN